MVVAVFSTWESVLPRANLNRIRVAEHLGARLPASPPLDNQQLLAIEGCPLGTHRPAGRSANNAAKCGEIPSRTSLQAQGRPQPRKNCTCRNSKVFSTICTPELLELVAAVHRSVDHLQTISALPGTGRCTTTGASTTSLKKLHCGISGFLQSLHCAYSSLWHNWKFNSLAMN